MSEFLPYGAGAIVLAVLLAGAAALLSRKVTKKQGDAAGLYGVVGRMGAGKTYFMTARALAARRDGRAVYANYGVTGCDRVRSWSEVLAVPAGSVVLLDEVHLWWPSETWQVDPALAAWVSQLRKAGITCYWSSQHEAFVSKRLRRLTFGYWLGERFKAGHRYSFFDAVNFESPSKRERLARHYLRRDQIVMDSYDTFELVEPTDPPSRKRDIASSALLSLRR